MRHLATLLAASASIAAAQAASAAVYLGSATSPGTIRYTNAVGQITSEFEIRTNWVEVQYCSGAVEYLSFAVIGPGRIEAVGSAVTLRGRIVGPMTTEYSMFMHAPTDAVQEIRIRGSNNTKMGFDLKTAPADTPGSTSGLDFAPVGMSGAWGLSVGFTDAVAYIGAAPAGDLFATMKLSFSSCFKPGDKLVFRVDTDRVN